MIIDDQFGRCSLGRAFSNSIDPRIFTALKADRDNLCANYALLDESGKSYLKSEEYIARATFCPAQKWNEEARQIENDCELAVRYVKKGWPFKDGSRWALILLDLAFVKGQLDYFGDPQERSLYGLEVILPRLKEEFGEDLPVVVFSSTRREENNAAVRRAGALDFIQRIPAANAPRSKMKERLREVLFFHGLLEDSSGIMAGRSLVHLKMLRQARRAAVAGSTVLLFGETGTGKNLLARYIHSVSTRKNKPFEVFNASHRSPQLQEDELFGHWKGAFTGAINDAPGIWERCSGGVVLIDEMADLDKGVQLKLMEPIETKKVKRMGHPPPGKGPVDVDVLTLLATNRDPALLGKSGVLKPDFLNRINANIINIPPLRERKEDIPLLIGILSRSLKPDWSGIFYPEAMEKLVAHSWCEGNVRELRNVIQSALLNNPGQDITAKDIHFPHIADIPEYGNSATKGADPLWSEFIEALKSSPGDLTHSEIESYRHKYHGAFTDLMAYMLSWAMRLNGNVSATARFLAGVSEKEMDTSAARQFLKKFLKMDIKGKKILKKFMAYPEAENPVIKKIVGDK